MKKTYLVIFLLLGLALITALSGCTEEAEEIVGEEEEQEAVSEKIVAAVSIVPQKAFLEAVGKDLVDVVLLVPPGNSPGNYEPTPQEMESFSQAEIYFAIGVPTEAANIMPQAEEFENMKIVRLQDEVAAVLPDREIRPDRRDPHIWLSPKRAKVMVEIMANELSLLDETNREIYEANAQQFIAELDELDKFLQETFSTVSSNKFIVFHPAFGYIADDYGLEMYALEQDGKEATPQRMQEMVDLAKKEGIKVIYYQKEIDSHQSVAFAEEIGGKTVQLAPLSPHYIDNLRKMAETMAEALQ